MLNQGLPKLGVASSNLVCRSRFQGCSTFGTTPNATRAHPKKHEIWLFWVLLFGTVLNYFIDENRG